MKDNQHGVVRLEMQNLEDLKLPKQQPQCLSERPFFSAINAIRKKFHDESLSFETLYDQSAKKPRPEEKILDPQGQFLHKWNRIFLISCVFAMAWDPLFFYIPVVDGKRKCFKMDEKLKIIACILRTFTDLFYLFHIILQFRTGFVSPSTRVLGRGELIKDKSAIARRYLSSYFIVDVLAVLPLPQMVVLVIIPELSSVVPLTSKGLLKLVIFTQYAPRIIRVYPLYKELARTSGIITETAWAGAASNLVLYMIASHMIGAVWYMISIDRQASCWHRSCIGQGCHHLSLYCKHKREGNYLFNETYCDLVDPDQLSDFSVFNFGLFYDALNSKVIESHHFVEKFFYCSWWGLRSLSSLGQTLETSTWIGESLFATFIGVAGLVLFALLIGNMQKYLQSTTVRVEEMRIRRQDAEQWMSHRGLPEDIRERIRRYEHYSWQVTRGVDEESVIRNLPKDLRRDIKRHLCLPLLMRVPMFEIMDEQLKDAMCDRLKPVLYTENSFIIREGDPINEMLFIQKGNLLTMTTNGGRTGFFNSVFIKDGDFCGEALLTWALDPYSSSLPISTRTVLSRTEVEAFALNPDDLKFLASQFRRLHSKQLRHTFRFYSQQWRTWAACFIQVAWRRFYRRKLEKSLQEAEEDSTPKKGGSSPSVGATFYVSRFAVNALRNLRRNSPGHARIAPRSPLLNLQKPSEPDFASGNG